MLNNSFLNFETTVKYIKKSLPVTHIRVSRNISFIIFTTFATVFTDAPLMCQNHSTYRGFYCQILNLNL